MGALADNVRLAARVAALGVRAGGRRIRAGATAALRAPSRSAEKLLIAPQDIRTTDPTFAAEIYAGTFAFAGRMVDAGGASPFLADAPSRDWAVELHGFGWLRHLGAADTALARSNARALVEEWMSIRGGPHPAARSPEAVARRLISWLSHAPLILENAERGFYRRFLKNIGRQIRWLRRDAPADGAANLLALTALAYAGLCVSGETRLVRSATRSLGEALDRQILADGGHVSRNPAVLLDLLLDLIPLRQAYLARDMSPPRALNAAIDRMTPMLRFFRHGDGAFAQFNGAGPVESELAAAALAYDDARGAPVEDASHSGYQRASAGEAVLIVDAGVPPPFELSERAHAGCLSFEFSSGPDRIVVNCGIARRGRPDWDRAGRSTAAHSTASIADENSCGFASGRLRPLFGARLISGPRTVEARRERAASGLTLTMSHDGYLARFGALHRRKLTLSGDGARLSGEDALPTPSGAPATDHAVTLRFHLHPSVRASATQDGRSVVLAPPHGPGWTFEAPGHAVTLEESIYFADPRGPRRSEQIVIATTLSQAARIDWSFERMEAEPASRRRAQVVEAISPLPL